MKDFQYIHVTKLHQMLEDRNYWTRIHNNKLLYKVQAVVPSKMVDGGFSTIISYYDEHLKYLCTIHRVSTKDGNTIHEDVKDALLDGVWYKSTK